MSNPFRDRPDADANADDRSFEAEALRCLDDVARFARSLCRDIDEADDVVQETYLRALRSRHTFRDGADMRRWLFTICKNVFLRAHEQAHETVSLDDDPSEETLAAVRFHNTLDAGAESGLFDHIGVGPAIRDALHAIPPAFRAAIVLVDLEGYGYEDAAAVLDVPVGTVRSRLFRGRRLLQQSLYVHARDAGLVRPSTIRSPA